MYQAVQPRAQQRHLTGIRCNSPARKHSLWARVRSLSTLRSTAQEKKLHYAKLAGPTVSSKGAAQVPCLVGPLVGSHLFEKAAATCLPCPGPSGPNPPVTGQLLEIAPLIVSSASSFWGTDSHAGHGLSVSGTAATNTRYPSTVGRLATALSCW